MTTPHEIVLLGANQGGIPLAHYLLRHTIPRLNALDTSHTYHLTLISPNTDYYWKLAAPRALIDPVQIPGSTIFKPISSILAQYTSSLWQHLPGKATAVDPHTKSVSVKLNDGTQKTLNYGSLVVATGVHYESPLYTTEYGTEALQQAMAGMHAALPKARSVIIAGGGPVGVETAGEIASNFPKAQVTLYSGASRLLERNVKENISVEAERQLKGLKVKVIHKVRVVESTATGTGAGEAATLKFNDGTTASADVYINAVAARQTAKFLPDAWLDPSGKGVKADKDTLRVTGAGAENVYALGDVNANSNGQGMWAGDGVRPLASALALDALKDMKVDEKRAAIEATSTPERKGLLAWLLSFFGSGSTTKSSIGSAQITFKSSGEGILVVPIGKSGTGILMGWKVPGWFAHMIKGKNYMVGFMEPAVTGEVAAKE